MSNVVDLKKYRRRFGKANPPPEQSLPKPIEFNPYTITSIQVSFAQMYEDKYKELFGDDEGLVRDSE